MGRRGRRVDIYSIYGLSAARILNAGCPAMNKCSSTGSRSGVVVLADIYIYIYRIIDIALLRVRTTHFIIRLRSFE